MFTCRLVSCESAHDPIIVGHDKPLIIGRGPLTKIKDSRLSREHIELVANCQTARLNVKLIGSNKCGAGGEILTKNQSKELKDREVITLLDNQYPYKVEFSPVPKSCGSSHQPPEDMTGKQTTLNSFVKRKIDSSPPSSDSKRKKKDYTWQEIDSGQLLVYTSQGVESRSKIAAFDLDGTIITTKSGRVFPSDCNDWILNYPAVPSKLQALWKDSFKIVFLTNQAGIDTGKVQPDQFRDKLTGIISKLGVPVQVFVSTRDSIYRKPCCGMWNYLAEKENDNITVNMDESFYCGDAAGRPANWAPGKKKDHSSVDRLMAVNLALKFYTPEEYFLNKKPVPYQDPEFDPRKQQSLPLLQPASAEMISNKQEVIIMVGFPGSGKSHFAAHHAALSKYDVINRDSLGSWQKCASALQTALNKGLSVIIDNTNPCRESRKKVIEIAAGRRVDVRCFVMNVTMEHAQHNNKFRQLIGQKHENISQMVYNIYKNKYEEPNVDEGFCEIAKVNFVGDFKSPKDKQLYEQFLR